MTVIFYLKNQITYCKPGEIGIHLNEFSHIQEHICVHLIFVWRSKLFLNKNEFVVWPLEWFELEIGDSLLSTSIVTHKQRTKLISINFHTVFTTST
jgi:hypothetical protein